AQEEQEADGEPAGYQAREKIGMGDHLFGLPDQADDQGRDSKERGAHAERVEIEVWEERGVRKQEEIVHGKKRKADGGPEQESRSRLVPRTDQQRRADGARQQT